MAKYRFTRQAVKDLTQIWYYSLKTWSLEQSERHYQMLISKCAEISNNHRIGKSYSQVHNGLLGVRAGRHIIFYRSINKDDIEVIRILHEEMDISSRINE